MAKYLCQWTLLVASFLCQFTNGFRLPRPVPKLIGTTKKPTEWDEDGHNFPDPQYDYTRCGVGKPSWICDPDGRLNAADVNRLQTLIQDTINGVKRCACDDKRLCTRGRGQYRIFIAVVSRLKSYSTNKTPVQKLETFTRALLDTKWFSHYACDDGIVIGLSVDDGERAQYTSVARVAARKIPSWCVKDIFKKLEDYFRRGDFYYGFKEMIEYYRNALYGGKCGTKGGLSAGQIAGIVVGVLLAVGGICALVICCVGFCMDCDCIVGTCIGICIGAMLGCIQGCINAIIIATCASMFEACGCDDCVCEPFSCVDDEIGAGGGGEF